MSTCNSFKVHVAKHEHRGGTYKELQLKATLCLLRVCLFLPDTVHGFSHFSGTSNIFLRLATTSSLISLSLIPSSQDEAVCSFCYGRDDGHEDGIVPSHFSFYL